MRGGWNKRKWTCVRPANSHTLDPCFKFLAARSRNLDAFHSCVHVCTRRCTISFHSFGDSLWEVNHNSHSKTCSRSMMPKKYTSQVLTLNAPPAAVGESMHWDLSQAQRRHTWRGTRNDKWKIVGHSSPILLSGFEGMPPQWLWWSARPTDQHVIELTASTDICCLDGMEATPLRTSTRDDVMWQPGYGWSRHSLRNGCADARLVVTKLIWVAWPIFLSQNSRNHTCRDKASNPSGHARVENLCRSLSVVAPWLGITAVSARSVSAALVTVSKFMGAGPARGSTRRRVSDVIRCSGLSKPSFRRH